MVAHAVEHGVNSSDYMDNVKALDVEYHHTLYATLTRKLLSRHEIFEGATEETKPDLIKVEIKLISLLKWQCKPVGQAVSALLINRRFNLYNSFQLTKPGGGRLEKFVKLAKPPHIHVRPSNDITRFKPKEVASAKSTN